MRHTGPYQANKVSSPVQRFLLSVAEIQKYSLCSQCISDKYSSSEPSGSSPYQRGGPSRGDGVLHLPSKTKKPLIGLKDRSGAISGAKWK